VLAHGCCQQRIVEPEFTGRGEFSCGSHFTRPRSPRGASTGDQGTKCAGYGSLPVGNNASISKIPKPCFIGSHSNGSIRIPRARSCSRFAQPIRFSTASQCYGGFSVAGYIQRTQWKFYSGPGCRGCFNPDEEHPREYAISLEPAERRQSWFYSWKVRDAATVKWFNNSLEEFHAQWLAVCFISAERDCSHFTVGPKDGAPDVLCLNACGPDRH